MERALTSWGAPIFILFLLVTLPSPPSRSLTLLRTQKHLIPDPSLQSCFLDQLRYPGKQDSSDLKAPC